MKQSAVDIDLTQIGDRLEIRFPYNADILCSVKKLPNRSYHPEGVFGAFPFQLKRKPLFEKHLARMGISGSAQRICRGGGTAGIR